jgi:hypothetical protein
VVGLRDRERPVSDRVVRQHVRYFHGRRRIAREQSEGTEGRGCASAFPPEEPLDRDRVIDVNAARGSLPRVRGEQPPG